jgi:glycosyltransferase involved in cell wall biosynthesis
LVHGRKVVVVLPAYRAEKTLKRTHDDIPKDVVDEVILVDDASDDGTLEVARQLGIRSFVHWQNLGYGANQKTCYTEALRLDGDIIVMVHPDYQYDARLITAMAAMIASGSYDVALGSRILGGMARRGGMPLYKYISNRVLTLFQNLLMGTKLSEFHTGYRAFSRRVLESLPLLANSDDFVFDNQMLTQIVAQGFTIGEISCRTRYFEEASSISFRRAVKYGLGVLWTSLCYRLWRLRIVKPRFLNASPTLRLKLAYYSNQNNATSSKS